MYAHKFSMHLVRKPVPSRLAVGALVALTLLSAACSNDSASRINAPPSLSLSRSDDGSSSSGATGSSFTVLAKTAVSCSGGSITGDVGTFQAPGDLPAGVVTQTTGCVINGTVHVGDAAAKAAFNSFLTAYTTLAPKTGDCDLAHTLLSTIPASVTLPPGTYCTGAALTATDVTLTLDGLGNPNAVWLFKIGTSAPGALTGTRFTVFLAPGANACNVTWWVNGATTMTNSVFKGNILAGAAISMTGGTLTGNAWSKADVTFTEGTVVTGCAATKGNGKGDDKDKDHDKDKEKCNQGIGNGREGCDPGDSNHHNGSNDEGDGKRGHSGRDDGR
jgi:Ice-binding-like